MKGYLKNVAASDLAFAGGWFNSGGLIISGGENISTIEIEDVLYHHHVVLKATIIAQPNEKWAKTHSAFTTLQAGYQNTSAMS